MIRDDLTSSIDAALTALGVTSLVISFALQDTLSGIASGFTLLADQPFSPGDWIIGDDDGVCVIPRDKAVEYTNRAMDVLERENRLRAEILAGSTLSQVGYLLRWEKK